MAKRKKGRDLSGIVLLDKSLGISSNKALQNIKILFNAQKAGHTGSLDPQASGLLPICLGEATKFTQYLLDADKVYIASIKLGQRTSTGDIEGEILEEKPCDFAFEVLVEVLSEFTGHQQQVPSMFSALKHNGQPLYKLARQGKQIERAPREIYINELRLLSGRELFEQEQMIEIYVHCSKGTYIRNLAEDIGFKANCGAHLQALRRIRIGDFDTMHSEAYFSEVLLEKGYEGLDGQILPIDAALTAFPQVYVTFDEAMALKQGRKLESFNLNLEGQALDKAHRGTLLRLYEPHPDGGEMYGFMGLARFDAEQGLCPNRLLRTN